jgi:predicted 3-demethylubiquinone-9 3-methyltransferase (glyoxalase superfamily)
VHHAPGDYPSGKQGDVLTVEFTKRAFNAMMTMTKIGIAAIEAAWLG